MSDLSDDQYQERVLRKYGDLVGELHIVELTKNGTTGIGLSLAGNKDLTTMSVFVVNVISDSPAAASNQIRVGDELLEINGLPLYGRSHLNASPIVKSITGPKVKILLLRSNSYLENLAVTPEIDCLNSSNKKSLVSSTLLTKKNSCLSISVDVSNDEQPEVFHQTETKMPKLNDERLLPSLAKPLQDDDDDDDDDDEPINKNCNHKNISQTSNLADDEVFINKSSDSAAKITPNNSSQPVTSTLTSTSRSLLEIQRNKLPLGVKIIGGSDCALKKVYVCEVYKNGAARLDGRLQVGDELLEINGESISGRSHSELQQLLRQNVAATKLTINREENDLVKHLSTTKPLPNNQCISAIFDSIGHLIGHTDYGKEVKQLVLTRRPNRPLGFVLSTVLEEQGFVATEVFKGLAAEADGLMSNDEIVSINGQPVKSLSFAHVASIIKTTMGHITFQILRIKTESNVANAHRSSIRKSFASPTFEFKKSRSFRNRAPLPACLKSDD